MLEELGQLITALFTILVIVSCVLVLTPMATAIFALWGYFLIGAIVLYVALIPVSFLVAMISYMFNAFRS